ncbi:hypothetical protein LSH36_230g00015 [Paralvinella palmiformis]|uniref:Uncharacterized protein n=1 Tax=Paralvinella palmiformis TaxID=53620 RepID=A0AAD9JM87_9ANNE|nr:hypothetical protein LSH36_230g00015 [Paralvinella palmiformis]
MENQTIRWGLISNISNSLTDRCAANHAAIQLVNASWDKTLNELNCHLHPLDSIAIKAQVWGSDCCASKIVVQMDKLARVTVRGFKIFLDDHKLPRCLIPRYRGNRLHVLFHIRGVFIEHHALFTEYLEQGPTCGGLRASVLADFVSVLGHIEMQVLGWLGKLLTGPWMKKLYTAAVDQIDHVEGIQVIKRLKIALLRLREPPVTPRSQESHQGRKSHTKVARVTPRSQESHQGRKSHTKVARVTPRSQESHQGRKSHTKVARVTPRSQESHQGRKSHTKVARVTPRSQESHQGRKSHTKVARVTPRSQESHQGRKSHTKVARVTPRSRESQQGRGSHNKIAGVTKVAGVTPRSRESHQDRGSHTKIAGVTPRSRESHQGRGNHTKVVGLTSTSRDYI